MRCTNQLDSLGDEVDLADADAILHLYRSLATVPANRESFANRTAREALQKVWQQPRMPWPRLGHNKPFTYPWSIDARSVHASGKYENRLVLDHVRPIGVLTSDLRMQARNVDHDAHSFRETLRAEHVDLSFVVITRAEDAALTKAGLRVVRPWDQTDPWAVYRAANIAEAGFSALDGSEVRTPTRD